MVKERSFPLTLRDFHTAIEGFTLRGVGVLVLAFGEDDKSGVNESVGEQVALDD